eukprot:11278978-Heterocapsa_arctica.AAC.1
MSLLIVENKFGMNHYTVARPSANKALPDSDELLLHSNRRFRGHCSARPVGQTVLAWTAVS